MNKRHVKSASVDLQHFIDCGPKERYQWRLIDRDNLYKAWYKKLQKALQDIQLRECPLQMNALQKVLYSFLRTYSFFMDSRHKGSYQLIEIAYVRSYFRRSFIEHIKLSIEIQTYKRQSINIQLRQCSLWMSVL